MATFWIPAFEIAPACAHSSDSIKSFSFAEIVQEFILKNLVSVILGRSGKVFSSCGIIYESSSIVSLGRAHLVDLGARLLIACSSSISAFSNDAGSRMWSQHRDHTIGLYLKSLYKRVILFF